MTARREKPEDPRLPDPREAHALDLLAEAIAAELWRTCVEPDEPQAPSKPDLLAEAVALGPADGGFAMPRPRPARPKRRHDHIGVVSMPKYAKTHGFIIVDGVRKARPAGG